MFGPVTTGSVFWTVTLSKPLSVTVPSVATTVQETRSPGVLVLVVNAAAQTAPHQVQALLDRMIRTG